MALIQSDKPVTDVGECRVRRRAQGLVSELDGVSVFARLIIMTGGPAPLLEASHYICRTRTDCLKSF